MLISLSGYEVEVEKDKMFIYMFKGLFVLAL